MCLEGDSANGVTAGGGGQCPVYPPNLPGYLKVSVQTYRARFKEVKQKQKQKQHEIKGWVGTAGGRNHPMSLLRTDVSSLVTRRRRTKPELLNSIGSGEG